MDAPTYIRRRVEAIIEHSEAVYQQAPKVANQFNSWSALKLILHSSGVNMYTQVMSNQPIEDIYYIDALAGSGVSSHDSGYFLGSALIACRAAQIPFSKMYFIDGNKENCNALEHRLEYVFTLEEFTEPHDWEVIPGNTNEEISEVVADIYDRSDFDDGFNYYAFIDNQGLDFDWESIEALTPTPQGDLLINLPTAHGIGRNIDSQAAEDFYGESLDWLNTTGKLREQLKRRYQARLCERDREVQVSTQVRADVGSFYYDLIYATRNIPGGNDYMEVMEYVKGFIEKVHSGNVDNILKVVRGHQKDFSSFLPDDEPEDELLEENEGAEVDPTRQTGLSEYQRS